MGLKKKIIVRCKTKEDLELLSARLYDGDKHSLSFGEDGVKSITLTLNNSPKVDLKKKVMPRKMPEPEWRKQWTDMNDFSQENVKYYASILFYLEEGYTIKMFGELVEQSLTPQTKSLYYPRIAPGANSSKRSVSTRGNPQYPIYVISKGRANTCVTAEHLIKMEVPFKIVIEKQEWEAYAKNFDEEYLLELDMSFRDGYDTYVKDWDEAEGKSKGSGPARNFVWWHSKEVAKAKWHWIMDDNIFGFYLLNNNMRVKATDGGLLAATEDFVNRYDNIGISGLNYFMFTTPGSKSPAYVQNTKIYSCLLINNDLPFRWSGRYNEDVDICIRNMKEGYSTIQFNAFLADKLTTQAMGGGNTNELYNCDVNGQKPSGDGTLVKSKMLASNHPDITTVVWRFSRWHHHTDYSIFSNNKDRSIDNIITALKEQPVLKPDCEETNKTIALIKETDFRYDVDWDELLKNISESTRRDKIRAKLKFYKYLRDSDKLADICTAPAVLNPDEDEDIIEELHHMEELLEINFNEYVDWSKHLVDVPADKKEKIIKEIQRNRMIRKEKYDTFDYNFKVVKLTQEEHLQHRDSKAYISKEYLGKDIGPEPLPLGDKVIRGLVPKPEKVKFTAQLTKGYDKVVREEDVGHALIVTGVHDFDDKVMLYDKVDELINGRDISEIVNGTQKGADSLAASYALDREIHCKNIRPDFVANSEFAIKVNNEQMANYADEAIVFLTRGNEDYTQMIEVMETLGKPVTAIYYDDDEDVFADF
jgi:hypothetical protein